MPEGSGGVEIEVPWAECAPAQIVTDQAAVTLPNIDGTQFHLLYGSNWRPVVM
jgi:hypothetical protein